MRVVIQLFALLLIAGDVTTWAQPGSIPFSAPDEASIPTGAAGDQIRRGRLILTHTPQQLPQYATSKLRCSNCHLKAGTVAYAAPWVGVTTRYPRYSSRFEADVSLRQRIQGCFKRSLNGVAPPVDSEPMDAIVDYMTWLSQGITDGYLVEGWGVAAFGPNPRARS